MASGISAHGLMTATAISTTTTLTFRPVLRIEPCHQDAARSALWATAWETGWRGVGGGSGRRTGCNATCGMLGLRWRSGPKTISRGGGSSLMYSTLSTAAGGTTVAVTTVF